MIERTSTCPIVNEVMEELKDSLGFASGGDDNEAGSSLHRFADVQGHKAQ